MQWMETYNRRLIRVIFSFHSQNMMFEIKTAGGHVECFLDLPYCVFITRWRKDLKHAICNSASSSSKISFLPCFTRTSSSIVPCPLTVAKPLLSTEIFSSTHTLKLSTLILFPTSFTRNFFRPSSRSQQAYGAKLSLSLSQKPLLSIYSSSSSLDSSILTFKFEWVMRSWNFEDLLGLMQAPLNMGYYRPL